jgi:hypothetical protein
MTNDDTSPRAKAARELREACDKWREITRTLEHAAEDVLRFIPADVPTVPVELKLRDIIRVWRSLQTESYCGGMSIFSPTPDVLEWARSVGKWVAYNTDEDRGVLRCHFDDVEFTVHHINRELQHETDEQRDGRRRAAAATAERGPGPCAEASAADCTCLDTDPDAPPRACPLHGAPEQVSVPSSFAAEFKGELL